MRRSKRLSLGALAVAGAGIFSACTASVPRELQDARYAYRRVAVGPAAQLNLPELAQARQALDAANRSFELHKDSPETRTLAYVALRRAELAEVRANTVLAERERAAADERLGSVSLEQQRMTQEELAAARAQLAEAQRIQAEARQRQEEIEQQRLSEAQARAQAEQDAARQAEAQRYAQAQAQLEHTNAQLEAERQARLEAERTVADAAEARERAQREAEARAREAAAALQRIDEVAVKEEARGTVVTLSGQVLFASGQANLLPSAQRRLDDVAQALRNSPNLLVIEGHTDSRGSERINDQLSYRRAQAVRDYLASRGVSADRIRAVGLGESRPIAENASPEGRANNRRVEIVIERSVASSNTSGTGGAGEEAQPQEAQPPRSP